MPSERPDTVRSLTSSSQPPAPIDSTPILSQPNSIELAIRSIPSAITDITTLNRHAVSLGPSGVRLAAPIHPIRIRIAGFHLLLLREVGVNSLAHVLHEHLGTCVAVGAVAWLADAEGGVAGGSVGLSLDVVVRW